MKSHTSVAICAALLATSAVSQDGSAEAAPASGRFTPQFAAAGSDVSIIYTNVVGHPTNVVPGTGGLPFEFNATSGSIFVRPNVTLDGQWVLEVDIDSGSTANDNAYVRNGQLLIREGDTPTFAPGDTWGTMDDDVGVNSTGDVLISNNLNGAAPTTADDVIVRIDAAGVQTLLAREGGLVDPIIPAYAGAMWEDNMDGPVLTETGLAGWRAIALVNTPSMSFADNGVVLLGNSIVYQKGTVPPGQMGVGGEVWENFSLQDFHVSIDGSVTLIQGDLSGATATDGVIARNGTIVLQEGFVIPGSSFVEPIDASGFIENWVDHGGNWYVRGNNDVTEQDWVVRNGTVVAISDVMMEIFPGAGEHWNDTTFSDCFFAFDGNLSGDYMIGGVTDAPVDQDGVLVMYPAAGAPYVIARENDPIDLDCNGAFDDDAFIRTFGNDDCLMLEDGSVLASITLRNAAMAGIGSAFVRIGRPTASCTANNGNGFNDPVLTCTTLPRLGKTWSLDVGLAPTTTATAVFLSFAPSVPIAVPTFAPYEILVDLSLSLNLPAAVVGTHNVTLPPLAVISWVNRPMFAQGFRIDAPGGSLRLVMTNRIDAVLGY